jgi:superfamily II DNA helicase RecQ
LATQRVVAELRATGGRSTGKLYTQLFPHHEMSRDDFEDLLGGMARAGIVRLDDAVFEKAGRQIPYRMARLTREGMEVNARTPLDLVMKDREPPATPHKRKKKGKAPISAKTLATKDSAPATVSAKQAKRPPDPEGDLRVEEALRAWRLSEARRLRVPPFLIFTDRALRGLVELRPGTTTEMLAVPGIGLRIAEKYGSEIRKILHGGSGAP